MPLRGGENLTLVGAHRIQDKCGYLCLTLNALLRIAVCSAQDALFGIVSIYKCPAPYSSMFCSGCPKCSYLEYSIQSRTCGCAELSEVSLVIQSAPLNIGIIWSPASYKILLWLEQYKEVPQSSILIDPFLMFPHFQKCLNPQVRTNKWC